MEDLYEPYNPPAQQYSPEPPKKQLPVKSLLIGLGIVLGVVLLVVVIVLLLRPSQQEQDMIIVQDSIERQAQISCAGEEDKEACLAREKLELSQQTGNATICEGFEGEEKETCIWNIANDKKDASICQALEGDMYMRCASPILLSLAVSTTDRAFCDQMPNQDLIDGCLDTLAATGGSSVCNELNREGVDCFVLEVTERAKRAQDTDICDELPVESAGACYDGVILVDRDFDGLTEAQEFRFSTDDRNEDTDGDGFLDGDEVQNGYNPNGPGTL